MRRSIVSLLLVFGIVGFAQLQQAP